MIPVYIAADNITSPLGSTTQQNYDAVRSGATAIRQINDTRLSPVPFYAAMFADGALNTNPAYTRFENLCIASVTNALANTSINVTSPDTLFILSTTKGNIELIEQGEVNEEVQQRVSLFNTAVRIAGHFGSSAKPLVLSNACISGVLAIVTAKRLMQQGLYKHVVIIGADVLSRFIITGFQSLNAMSANPCKPFDNTRDGINLGECAATVILTTDSSLSKGVEVNGGSSTNDANHISGPSRSGAELDYAASTAMQQSGVGAEAFSFVSAHGTATVFNDEMEAKAFNLAGGAAVPVHSLKPHFGHTLGAAGVLESVLSYTSLLQHEVLPSANYTESGVSQPVNVSNGLHTSNKNH